MQKDPQRTAARGIYQWLWASPLLTIPTLVFLLFSDLGREWVCNGSYANCGYGTRNGDLAENITTLVAVLGSAAWHLILALPTKENSEFVRWHRRQALLLAGLRTAVALTFGIFLRNSDYLAWVIPTLILIWLISTSIGQSQAARGDCTLMRWMGRSSDLAALPVEEKSGAEANLPALSTKKVNALVEIIRHETNPVRRAAALDELKNHGLVETF